MEQRTKVLIVEDEMIIAESISDILEELEFEVLGIHMRARNALESIKINSPDLLLLDINLKGEEDGIWLAKQLKSLDSFPFIFLTSYGDKKTIDRAVNASPYGYLLKPIERQSLYSAIKIAQQRFLEERSGEVEPSKVFEDHFFIKDNFEFARVEIDSIRYIKSDDNYLEIVTSEKKHIVRSTLKEFAKNLPEIFFLQTHRSYIVNVRNVDSFSSTYVVLGKEKIPISKNFQDIVFNAFQRLG